MALIVCCMAEIPSELRDNAVIQQEFGKIVGELVTVFVQGMLVLQ